MEQEGAKPLTPEKLQYRLGISEDQIKMMVDETKDLFWLSHKQSKWLVTKTQWANMKSKIQQFLSEFHKKNPLQPGAQKEEIRQHIKSEESILDALLMEMQKENMAVQKGKVWLDPEFTITLSNEDDSLQNNVLDQLNQEGFTPSNLSQLSSIIGDSKEKLMRVLKVAEQQGKLLRIDGKLMFTKTNFLKLREKVTQHFSNHTEMSVSEFKELAHTSRKYAVPLLEYFDKLKITYREGNTRKLVK